MCERERERDGYRFSERMKEIEPYQPSYLVMKRERESERERKKVKRSVIIRRKI